MGPIVRATAAIAAVTCTWSCAARQPASSAGQPHPPVDLARAEALVADGCYRCLEEALAITEPSDTTSGPSRQLAFDAALLLAARDRELGTLADDHLQAARSLASDEPRDQLLLSVVDAMPWPRAAQGPEARDDALTSWRRLEPLVKGWQEELSHRPSSDLPARYLLEAIACTWPFVRPGDGGSDEPLPDGSDGDIPLLLRYKRLACSRPSLEAIAALRARAPRYAELDLLAGDEAMNGGALLTAERHYRDAFAGFPSMLPAAHGLARLHVMLEEYEASLPEYDVVLTEVTDQQDAMLGKARALSQLGRHPEAMTLLDRLIAIGTWLVGDAHYWRGWNRLQMGDVGGAGEDADAALRLMVNARVHVLAGAVAARRGDWARARHEFETALPLDETDCDIPLSLGSVLGQLRDWKPAYDAYARAAACLVDSQAHLSRRVEEITAAAMTENRRERFLARSRAAIAVAHRQEGQSRYNAAVSLTNLGRADEARSWAEEARQWPEWTERAARLLQAPAPAPTPR